MATPTLSPDTAHLWTEEPAERPDRARIRARIGGLHCSLCTGTIEKALGRQPGVDKVAVSLTHEQALVEYDPAVARPEALLQVLKDIGYTIHDPRKLRPFEEEERDLVREGRRFFAAIAFSLLSIALVRLALVTGDSEGAARRVAHQAGIAQVFAGVLPGAKAGIVRDLQRQGRVAMVGDGINDAPALMQADVGIAMGGGSDIAIDSADIIILNGNLHALAEAREISRRSYRKMLQNVVLAFLFNGIGIPAAATGLVYPVWAMAAMALSVTTIFFNSLWGQPSLFFDAVMSVGRRPSPAAEG